MADKKPIELEEGWSSMQVRPPEAAGALACMREVLPSLTRARSRCGSPQHGIVKLIRLLEGEKESQFNAEQYMMLYTWVLLQLLLSCRARSAACSRASRASQDHLQHVHPETALRLL